MIETTLTDEQAMLYLLRKREAEKMPGTIRTKEKCPKCNKPFASLKAGFICKKHRTFPQRFFIDVYYGGRQIKVYSHKAGFVLSSYELAQETLKHIQHEIRNRTFDPTKFVKAELSQYQCDNLIDKYLRFKGVVNAEGELINDGDKSTIAPSYRKDYKRMLDIAKGYFKRNDVRDLRKKDITEYWQHLKDLDNNYSNKTIKNMMDLFKTFLNYCKVEMEFISIIPPFPSIEVSEHRFKWVAQKDQIPLFNLIPDEDKSIIAFLMLHGCRPGEARALKCKDVDLRNETITISATWSGTVYREKRKGKKAKPVTIPIHPEMIEHITDRVKNNLPEAYVFVDRRGRYYTDSKMFRIWQGVRKAAKLDMSLRLYDFTRHSFASNLINSGTSLFKVSKLLGHSSTKMTEKYTHTDVENLRTDLHKLSLKTIPRLSPEQKKKGKC